MDSILQQLRALVPDRRTTHIESLRIAERQARLLRELLDSHVDTFDTDLVKAIPRITIDTLIGEIPFSGASFWNGNTWHVHIRGEEPLTHQRFTILHELKHILDHPVQARIYDDRAFVCYGERELIADYFAACVLLPEDRFRAAYKKTHDHQVLADQFGVSVRRILYRLSELDLTETVTQIPLRSMQPAHVPVVQRAIA